MPSCATAERAHFAPTRPRTPRTPPFEVRDPRVACDAALVLDTLGRAIARRPRATIVVWLLFAAGCFSLAFTGIDGVTVFDRLTTGAPGVPGSESSRAGQIIAENTTSGPSLSLAVVGVDPTTTDLSGPVERLRAELMSIPGVASVIDPFIVPDGPGSRAAAPLVAVDGDGFLVVVELDMALTETAEGAALKEVEDTLREAPGDLSPAGDLTGRVGGTSLIVEEITGQVENDLATGEGIALPIALLVMVLVFGGFLAAAMPIVGAMVSIAVGLAGVYALSYALEMEATVVNVVSVLGLGLSIDYGLLIVSRFREELHAVIDDDDGVAVRQRRGDGAVETALRATLRTAGRTVTFSALTVAISVAGLVVFEPDILRAFGVAGATVILIAVTTALTLVPAMLCLTGRRLVRPGAVSRIPGLRRLLSRTGDVTSTDGVFSRLASWVQQRPWRVLFGSLLVLALLAVPAAHIELRNSTVELLPPRSDQRAYVEQIARQYPGSASAPITMVAETGLDEATAWAHSLAALPDIASVDAPVALGPYALIGIWPDSTDNGGAGRTPGRRGGPSGRQPLPVLGDGVGGQPGRLRARAGRTRLVGRRDRRSRDTGTALPDDRLRAHPDQGAAHERRLALRGARRAHLGLPVRQPVGAARLHPERRDRDLRRRVRRRVRVRTGDGLRGLPALPGQGGARRRWVERRGGAPRPPTVGADHHLGGGDHHRGLRRVRVRQAPRDQGGRPFARRRRPDRRHSRAHAPRSGDDDAPRTGELVGARVHAATAPTLLDLALTDSRHRCRSRRRTSPSTAGSAPGAAWITLPYAVLGGFLLSLCIALLNVGGSPNPLGMIPFVLLCLLVWLGGRASIGAWRLARAARPVVQRLDPRTGQIVNADETPPRPHLSLSRQEDPPSRW